MRGNALRAELIPPYFQEFIECELWRTARFFARLAGRSFAIRGWADPGKR